MIKKIKLNDLEEETEEQVIEKSTPKIEKKSLDSISKKTKKPEIKIEKKVKPSLKKVRFSRNLISSFFYKSLGFITILFVIDVISHAFQFFDGINIMDINNYQSIYFSSSKAWIILKFLVFFFGIFIFTPTNDVSVNKEGIYCVKSKPQGVMYRQEEIYLKWDEISGVLFKTMLFEPYLVFYNKKWEKIGMLQFALNDEKKFFNFILKQTSNEHPLYLVKDKLS